MKNRSLQLKRVAFALFVLLLSVAGVKTTNAQNTVGTDFWVTFLPNHDGAVVDLSLIAAGSTPCTGTITNPYTNWSTSFEVSVGATTIIEIPRDEAYSDDSDCVLNTALHVISTDSISLYASNFRAYSFDVTDVLPTSSLGSNYIIQTYPGNEDRNAMVSPSSHTKSLVQGCTEFSVLAVEDNTTVYITLTCNSNNGHYANQPFSVTLNAGQCYQVKSIADGDFSGSQVSISGNKRVAVFGGNSCANVLSYCGYCDHIVEQMMPVSCWGNHFVVTGSSMRTFDAVRVTAANDDCQIFINGSLVTTINQRETYQFEITSDNPSLYLETSEQVMVYLYYVGSECAGDMGDPSMVLISPIEQRMNYVTFSTFNSGVTQYHFVNIVTNTDDVSSMQLDGSSIASEFQTVSGNSGYSFARVAIEHGSHTLSTTGAGFVAHVYGLGDDESYAYSVGTNAVQELYTNMLVNGQTASGDMDVCGQTVNFDLNYNYNVSQVNWDFGDGQTGSGIPITHEYPDLGDYAVSCDVYKLDSYGQDSLVATLTTNLQIYESYYTEFSATAHNSYTWEWMGETYYQSGDYSYNGQTIHGCDSIVTLHLTITHEIIAEANPTEGGIVTGGGMFNQGQTCTLTAMANAGYDFMCWTNMAGEVVSLDSEYIFTVTEDMTFTACFAEEGYCGIKFDLYDSYGDGWTSNYLVVNYGDGASQYLTLNNGYSATYVLPIADGSHVTLGWISGSWIGECSYTLSYLNGNEIFNGYNMNSDFMFEFDMDCVNMPVTPYVYISVEANPYVGGTVSGGGSYRQGLTHTITAVANDDYIFTNWTKNGMVVSTNANYSFTVTENADYVANFITLQVIAEYYPDVDDPGSPYVKVHWSEETPNVVFGVGFEDGLPEGWTIIDANGDGYTWTLTSNIPDTWTNYSGSTLDWYHGGSNAICSGSYINGVGSLTPDEYLISPLVNLTNGSQLNFWVAATDASYAADHFGVFVSTTGTEPSDFMLVQEWTLTAKNGSKAGGSASRDGRGLRLGNWYNYTVDLSNYAGQAYIAFRHFNCYDQYIMCLDDVILTAGRTNSSSYRLYRANCDGSGLQMIADNLSENQYIDIEWPEMASGNYKYGVSVVDERGNVSEIHWNNTPVTPTHHTLDVSAFLNPVTNNRNHGEPSRVNYDNGWLYYDDGSYATSIGTGGGTVYWGIMFPSDMLISYVGNSLTKVALFENDYNTEPITLSIYLGGTTAPQTLVSTMDYNPIGGGTYNEITLTSPVPIDGTQNLWIVFNEYGTYPINSSNDPGDPNGRWISIDGSSWSDVVDYGLYYGWMIRGYIEGGGSEIFWSNCIDKDMYLGEGEVNVTVLLNSGDSPAGTMVSFTNLDSNEQELYPVADITLDGSGYYAWDNFRKGDYQVTITKEGYTTITETVGIWEATSLSYVLEEITQSTTRLYVSSTGWAKWNGLGDDLNTIAGLSDSFYEGFDNGLPENWSTIDGGNPTGYGWQLGSTKLNETGYGHNGSNDLMISESYDNNYGAIYPDNYLISPQVRFGSNSVFSFYACAQDASWAAEHFGVAISTTGNTNASDFTTIQEWTMTAKGEGGKAGHSRDGGNRAQGNWYYYTVDLSAYAGQSGYIAIRHFNCTDWFYLDVDDVEFTSGRDGDRHYEYNQVVLTNAQGNVLYTENTTNKYCQLPVGNLIEGETYHCKVASVYSSGLTEWAETDWVYQSCNNYEGANDLFATTTEEGNLISWTYPEMGRDNTRGSLAYSCRNNSDWVSYYTDDPFNATYLNSISLYGGDYCPLDGYVYATHGSYAYKIEPQTGTVLEEEYIGYNFYDCAWDYTTNTMYAVRDQDFYIWNLENNTVEYIGSADPSFEVLACDLNGELYGIAVGYPAALYKIDKTNASLELVGYTGQNCDYYWQSGNIDHTNGKLYWTNTMDGTLVEVDIETGESTVLNTDIGQNTSFCIPYDGVLYILGAMVYRDNELVGFTSDNSYFDLGETANHQYDIRLVYGGPASCPDNNIYYSMSCPQTASDDEGYHWSVNIYEYPYNMSVTGIIQINGVEQQTAALEIGAFCGDECRGTQRLTYYPQVDRYLVFLTLYGDAGDVMNFRLYNHALGQELDLSCSSTISFVPDGFMGTPFDPYVFDFGGMTVEQVSNFSQGYNWWSTCIEQEGINGLAMLQEGLGSNGVTIRSQASGYTDYYQGYGWYGSLSSINNESSYRIITSAPCTVTMTGSAAVPSQHPITLSQGWTWIGYVPSTAMGVDAAMIGVNAVQGDKLKSQQGYADYYPGYGWYGSLNTIEPGMGLMYYSANSATTTFTYPDNNRGGELEQNLTAENNHWVPNIYAYPDNMTMMAVVELDDRELTSDNYELAAFTANGECRGSVKLAFAEPLNRHVAFLTIAGEDAAELSFRLYDTETNVEYYDAEESLDFVADAIVGDANDLYTIHFRGTTGLDEFANKVRVYPNPVNRGERVSIGMNAESKMPVRVEIVNALGVIVSVETSTQAPASIVAPVTAGVYMLRIIVEGKETVVRKLVVK